MLQWEKVQQPNCCGRYVCYGPVMTWVSMVNSSRKQPQALFFETTFSLLKLANHVIILIVHVYFVISMTTIDKNGLRRFSLQLLLHFSMLQTVQHMKVKLVYFSVSMMTVGTFLYNYFFTFKLVNYTMHGSETWYA